MSKEKMAELKITIPARWLNFMRETYNVLGLDFDKEMRSMVKGSIEVGIDLLAPEDTIRLVEKHKIEDVYKISQWERDKAAGIQRNVEPKSEESQVHEGRLVEALGTSLARSIWRWVKDATPDDIKRIRAMTSEELEERIKTSPDIREVAASSANIDRSPMRGMNSKKRLRPWWQNEDNNIYHP